MIEGFNGFGYTLAELALMDLAVRATPAGSEGLGFSLMMSVRNLALFGTDWFGSKLLDQYHVSFNSLVLANSATTLITVPLVFLLPLAIVSRKDAELYRRGACAQNRDGMSRTGVFTWLKNAMVIGVGIVRQLNVTAVTPDMAEGHRPMGHYEGYKLLYPVQPLGLRPENFEFAGPTRYKKDAKCVKNDVQLWKLRC